MKITDFEPGMRVFMMAKVGVGSSLVKFGGVVGNGWDRNGHRFLVRLDNDDVVAVTEENCGVFQQEMLN
jgi:hypothetical protein